MTKLSGPKIEIINSNPSPLKQAKPGDAGYDLRAMIEEKIWLHPHQTTTAPTGIKIHIKDHNIAGLILSRSGLGGKLRIRLPNGVGLIDSGYTGEIQLYIENAGAHKFLISPNDRIAQIVFIPVIHPNFIEVNEFSETSERGEAGGNSTGIK